MTTERFGFLDPTGMPTAGWGVSLSAYEIAQIGLMVLNHGVYNNTRIVSENWIEMMTKTYISTDEKFGNQDNDYNIIVAAYVGSKINKQ